VAELEGHVGFAIYRAWSPNGTRIATGSRTLNVPQSCSLHCTTPELFWWMGGWFNSHQVSTMSCDSSIVPDVNSNWPGDSTPGRFGWMGLVDAHHMSAWGLDACIQILHRHLEIHCRLA